MGQFIDEYNAREKIRIDAENEKLKKSMSLLSKSMLNMHVFTAEIKHKFDAVFDEFVSDANKINGLWASKFNINTSKSIRFGVVFNRDPRPKGQPIYEEHNAFWIEFIADSNTISYDYIEPNAGIISQKDSHRGLIDYLEFDKENNKIELSAADTAKQRLSRYFADFTHPEQRSK